MIAESRRNAFWFGTEEKMGWFPTPNRGAQTGGSGWAAEGTTLNGGGFQLNSFGSHRQYIFEWPNTSSAKTAQMMKSYADGSFGRGLIYFLDPLIYTTNVLPAMWADPSMGIGQEGASLVYGVEASGLPTSDNPNDLPVKSAYYDLGSIAAGWRGKEDAVFVPVPEGYTFSFGSIHSQTGQGRVLYRTQSRTGALGAVTAVTPLLENTSQLVNTFISGPDLAGVWLFVGKVGAGAGSVTLTAMTGRLLPTVKSVIAPVATNLFTNPRLVGDGTWAEVRRNLYPDPRFTASGGLIDANTASNSMEVSPSGGRTVTRTGASGRSGFDFLTKTLESGKTYAISFEAESSDGFVATSANILNPSYSAIPLVSRVYVGGRVEIIFVATLDTTFRVRVDNGSVVGGWTRIDKCLLEEVDVSKPYFDGSMPFGAVDPDMRQRWLGAPNASESVMEIERVAGLTGTNCVAGVSTKDGKPAVRIIPTGAGNAYATIPIPSGARDAHTLLGVGHIDGPLPSSTSTVRRAITSASPQQVASPFPNEAGSHPLRFVRTSPLTNTFIGIFGHGGKLGDPDVWWTDIGLFAGTYDGPAFNGSSGTIMIGSQLATTEWDGTIDNSTSTAYSTSTELINIRKGPWVGGQGHSGCRFIGKPTEIKYGPFNGGQVGFAASFREVGSWLYG